jgi:hypothetical protein
VEERFMKTLISRPESLSGLKVLWVAFAFAILANSSAFGVPTVYENFTNDTDAYWDGSGNRSNPGANDYGWSDSDNTGNVVTAPSGNVSAAGEAGGFMQRGNTSYYGFDTGDINPETDTFHADGVYRYVSGSGNMFFGFFNAASHMTGGDTRNFIGIQMDDGRAALYHGSTGVSQHREHNGPVDVASSGATIKWSIDWDPVNGADMTIGSDSAHVDSEFGGEAHAMLNRFGFFSGDTSDTVGQVYWDDITFSSNNPVPEPATLVLLSVGLLSMGTLGLRRRLS